METNKRNLGIDFLRIISMFMVVALHILGNRGILFNTVLYTMNYNLVWLLEILAYCSVNCYALITGYVSTDTKFKYSRIISLWFQLLFIRLQSQFSLASLYLAQLEKWKYSLQRFQWLKNSIGTSPLTLGYSSSFHF